MIELADDDYLGTLHQLSEDDLKYLEIVSIEDAGDFSPDEDVNWAVCVDGTWFIGDRPQFGEYSQPINPPKWATHVIWCGA